MSTPNAGVPGTPAAPSSTPAPEASSSPAEGSAGASEGSTPEEVAALEAAEAEAAKEAAAKKSNKKKFKVKVDSKEEEIELDFDNEEEIQKHLQLSKAAQKRMQQFAEYEKGVKGLLETLRTDPLKVLSDKRLGIPEDVRQKLAESIMNQEIEEMQKTPEQKAQEKIQKEYEELKKQHEEMLKAKEEEKDALTREKLTREYDLDISSAIEKAGMPKNARTVRYFAEAMAFCVENNINMTAQDLIPYVKKNALSEFRELVTALPDEDFEDWLGKDQISRIRKRTLDRIKKSAPGPEQVKAGGDSDRKPAEPQPKVNMKDFMKSLGGKF